MLELLSFNTSEVGEEDSYVDGNISNEAKVTMYVDFLFNNKQVKSLCSLNFKTTISTEWGGNAVSML